MNQGLPRGINTGLPQIAAADISKLGRGVDTNPRMSPYLSGIPTVGWGYGKVPRWLASRRKWDLAWPSPAGLFNMKPTSLPYWKQARSRSIRGGAPCHLALIGDSTSCHANSTVDAIDILATQFTRTQQYGPVRPGVYAITTGAGSTVTAKASAYDGNPVGIGGALPVNGFTWTPSGTIDTWVIWYVTSPPSGTNTFVPAVDGASQSGVSTVGASNSVTSTTITMTAGTHTLTIPQPAGSAVYIMGVEAYLSTNNYGVKLTDMAQSGATSVKWVPDYSTPQAFYGVDCAFYVLGINDQANVVYGNTVANIAVARAKSMDMILVAPAPFNDRFSDTKYEAYYQAALDTDSPLLDLRQRWSQLPISVAAGLGVGGHPNDAGQGDTGLYYDWALRMIT